MYQWHTQVRYSEIDEDARLTVGGLINYLQDCCTFQSEDLGVGIAFLHAHQCAWVISGWEIEILRMPEFTEHVDVQTWPYEFKGFYGYRYFQICSEDGACIARANSLWVLVNEETGRPMRVFDELTSRYSLGEKPDMGEAPRKMRISPQAEIFRHEPVLVQRHHLDTNHHVNNGQYVQIAMECLEEGKEKEREISRIRVQYKTPAVLGDTLYPVTGIIEGRRQVELQNEQGLPYAVVELSYRQTPHRERKD